MVEASVSLGALLDQAARTLREAGLADPRREAWRLWADLAGTGRAQARLYRERPVAEPDAEAFRGAVARLAAGEPLAYVAGTTGFRRLTIACDHRALIPRPETEGLVELLLACQPTGRVADVGTGTGCVALALADEGRYQLVLGLDRSREALALARRNRDAAGLPVQLAGADLLTALPAGALDAVISNPPYLTEGEHVALDRSVRDWEPRDALVSGPDGLAATRALLRDALRVVRPGGWLALELDSTRAVETKTLACAAGWVEAAVHHDLFGRARYLLARRSEAE